MTNNDSTNVSSVATTPLGSSDEDLAKVRVGREYRFHDADDFTGTRRKCREVRRRETSRRHGMYLRFQMFSRAL